MKQIILSGWTIMRFLRLAMGIAILVQAVITKDILFAFAGILFTAMPVFNIGCCGTKECYTPVKKNNGSKKEISYEELV